ncbi:MAG: citramalate synthase [Clostridia bacterium]|nr:citramalate synthase [Clostridia bacterium]
MAYIEFLDTTLRDGAQAVGISFSVKDMQSVFKILDEFGIDIIEGGDPASNPKDEEFFKETRSSRLAAFGATHRKDTTADKDENIKKLIQAGTDTVVIFGKSSEKQATEILGISKEENLKLISSTVSYLVSKKKRVIFDAEHFFDSFLTDEKYALTCLNAAADAGADTLVLCDTNGGTMPDTVFRIVKTVTEKFSSLRIGIHAHNDCGMAVANSVMAAQAGATHVQGTFLGFGERCGNANLSTIIANLSLKGHAGCRCHLEQLTSAAKSIAEIANLVLPSHMPYVGNAAFSHKAGMHVDAVIKESDSFEHIDPRKVGNDTHLILSEFSGKSAIIAKLSLLFPDLDKSNPKVQEILNRVKELENEGYQFEGAEASFILMAEKIMRDFNSPFALENYSISTSSSGEDMASVSIRVGNSVSTGTCTGNGPVNALDKALRKALAVYYPSLNDVQLIDYKVRVVDSTKATGADVRVLITSKDKSSAWTTIGVSTDIIRASFNALADSFEYILTR